MIAKVLPSLSFALHEWSAARGEGATDGGGGARGGGAGGPQSSGPDGEGQLKCFNCNGFGHLSRDCPFEYASR